MQTSTSRSPPSVPSVRAQRARSSRRRVPGRHGKVRLDNPGGLQIRPRQGQRAIIRAREIPKNNGGSHMSKVPKECVMLETRIIVLGGLLGESSAKLKSSLPRQEERPWDRRLRVMASKHPRFQTNLTTSERPCAHDRKESGDNQPRRIELPGVSQDERHDRHFCSAWPSRPRRRRPGRRQSG